MARYTDSVCRQCRREGMKLFLKGDRCYNDAKCAVVKRHTPPGQHGQARARKLSEYGTQLREKQKCRRAYGVSESQFHKYYETASNMKGVTGENLLSILESRIDNVVFRAGFAMSRPEARQLVRHGHFTVNGKKVNIPSYLVKAGDVIAVKETSRNSVKIKNVCDATAGKPKAKWLDVDVDNMQVKVVSLAAREDIDLPIEEHLIVELYSK